MDEENKKKLKDAAKTAAKIGVSALIPGALPIVLGSELIKRSVSAVGGKNMGRVAGALFGSDPTDD